jgi:uncharacterized membrane protein YedE/YeeE
LLYTTNKNKTNYNAVHVLTFMASGAAAAAALGRVVGVGVARNDAPSMKIDFPLALAAAAAAGAAVQLLPVKKLSALANAVVDGAAGAAFAAALTLAGMTRPSKVVSVGSASDLSLSNVRRFRDAFLMFQPILTFYKPRFVPSLRLQFLDFANPGHGWDPTLAFVMGAALCVATPAYLAFGLAKRRAVDAETCDWAGRAVDTPTVVGGVLFGGGWALAGMCPGPALTTLGASLALHGGVDAAAAAFVAAMFAARPVARFFAPSCAPCEAPEKKKA